MQPPQHRRTQMHRCAVVDLHPQAAEELLRVADIGAGKDEEFGVVQTRVDAFLAEHEPMLGRIA